MKLRRSVYGLLALLGVAAPIQLFSAPAQAQDASAVREVRVEVDGAYRPSRIELAAGERVRLVFVRRDYGPCTREVVFPSLGIRRELPTNQPVIIELPALTAGEHEFRCGMNMIRGAISVSARR